MKLCASTLSRALGEVLSSLVQHPSPRHTAKLLMCASTLLHQIIQRNCSTISLSSVVAKCPLKNMRKSRQNAPFTKREEAPSKRAWRSFFSFCKTTHVAFLIFFTGRLARYRSHHPTHSCAACWHWRNWLFDCSYSSLCCKEA